jgi:hypothetical protein
MAHVSIQSENRGNFSGQPSGGCIIADNRRPLHSKKMGRAATNGLRRTCSPVIDSRNIELAGRVDC